MQSVFFYYVFDYIERARK